jgi:hypothetical protein
MRTTTLGSLAAAFVVFSAGQGFAQAIDELEFYRADWNAEVPAVIGFTAETDGSRRAVVVARSRVDRPLDEGGTFRGIVMRAEVRCSERSWRIVDMTRYDANYAAVSGMKDAAWAPLVRETPLHASIADVCDGGHLVPAGLRSDDPVEVQRWLDGL